MTNRQSFITDSTKGFWRWIKTNW